jgi:hypothetical protein
LKAINDFKNHLYDEHPLKKRGFCLFCSKKSNLNPSKKQELSEFSPYLTLKLNKEDNSALIERKEPKRKQYRGKSVKWWCQECNKFICKDCWSLYY